MPLNSSGPISLGGSTVGESIALELGLSPTATISLNDPAVRTLAGVPSGTIRLPQDFWGKSSAFVYTISANANNVDVRALAVTAGWDQSSQLQININSGVLVSSNSTTAGALIVNGPLPGGIKIINNGEIIGRGGAGGYGGSEATSKNAGPGQPGGDAIKFGSGGLSLTLNNLGTIAGGGGGGAGGGATKLKSYINGGGGGGGRSTNQFTSAGGTPNGGVGNYNGAGAGGSGYEYGATGGNWGATGGALVNPGGAGGYAIRTAGSSVTYINQGQLYGAVG